MLKQSSVAAAAVATLTWTSRCCHAWMMVPPGTTAPRLVSLQKRTSLKESVSSSSSTNVLDGVEEFEEWFGAAPKAECSPSVRHAAFDGDLRGLTSTVPIKETSTQVMKIPSNLVLKSEYTDNDWDSQLAEQLWTECLKGKASDVYGYCQLLTRGMPLDVCPPSTAPNALWHWTDDQKKVLETNEKGRKLLDYQQKQEKEWREKYESLSSTSRNDMTWEQFQWAMEVVNSRAFCGNFWSLGGNMPAFVPVIAPITTGAVGVAYLQNNADPSDLFLLGLAIVGALPVVFAANTPEIAVLLPFIDSANHLETSDSKIQYNAVTREFVLEIVSKSLVTENNGMTQLYISYGSKSDAELLNNYGFLPGVEASGESQDEQRTRLAQAYIERNS